MLHTALSVTAPASADTPDCKEGRDANTYTLEAGALLNPREGWVLTFSGALRCTIWSATTEFPADATVTTERFSFTADRSFCSREDRCKLVSMKVHTYLHSGPSSLQPRSRLRHPL